MPSRIVTVGLVQMRMVEDPAKNLQRALEGIQEAAGKGADVICLSELFLGPYFCQIHDDARADELLEAVPGTTTKILSEAAKKHEAVIVGGSIYEKGPDGHRYNTCPVFEKDGTLLGTYRKTHIPQDPGYYEQEYFIGGKNPVTVITTSAGNICPMICFDQWSAESARLAALRGAELIVYPTAIGNVKSIPQPEGSWQEGWEIAQRGHSAVNQVYVAAVNRVGTEGETTFWGGSFIAGPFGQIRAKGGSGEEIVIADCDVGRVKEFQDAWGILRNRRPDLYADLTQPNRG